MFDSSKGKNMRWESLALACLWENIGVQQDKIHHCAEVNVPCEILQLVAWESFKMHLSMPAWTWLFLWFFFFIFIIIVVSSRWRLLYAFRSYKPFYINLEIDNFSSAGVFSPQASCFFQLSYLIYSLNIRLLLLVLRFNYSSWM